MLFGVDYYPEHWDKKEWKNHVKIMRDGNFNTVRIAEFAWSRIEVEEGKFDFSWLDEAIETLAAEGIRVILGTPTATPPKWLVNKYDVYLRDKYGRARGFGSRREYCSNNDMYIEKSRIVVEKMAERYGNNPNVMAWQIDNEFGCHGSTRCYCEHCKKEFSHWLEKKYKNIDNLNKTYGTVFWSQEYADFDDVILPAYTSCDGDYGHRWTHNPSLDLDFHRFSSESWVKYQQLQIDIIRKYSNYPITHNFMGHFSDIDYYDLGKSLDVVSWDNYIDNQWNHCSFENTSMAHEITRGIKDKNFWVMEQQAGPCGWDVFGGTPRPGQLRLWTYQAIAHGAEGMVYFRFKSAPFGMEQYWLGVVDHDGVPRRRFREIAQTGEELHRLSPLFIGAKNKTDVLIVRSYDEVWGHKIKAHVAGFNYRNLVMQYYIANNHIGTNAVCGSEDMISNRFKTIYMPAYSMVSDEVRKQIETYVANGGTLVLTYRSGIKNLNANMVTETLPGQLRELTGITVTEFDSSPVTVKLSDNFGTSSLWRDIIETDTAEVKAVYESEFYKGTPAVTVNRYGKGKVWYIACDLEDDALERLVKTISDDSAVEYIPHPNGTEIIRRHTKEFDYYMLLNYTDLPKEVDIKGKSLISGNEFNGILKAYGVEIVLIQ